MSVEQAEAALEVERLKEKNLALREAAYAEGATAEDIAAFKAANAELAIVATAYKEKFPAPTPEPGDAAATPASVGTGVNSVGSATEEA
jgi:hypothetical protein